MAAAEPAAVDLAALDDTQLERWTLHLATRVERLAGDLEACLEERERRGGSGRLALTGTAQAYLADRRADQEWDGTSYEVRTWIDPP